MINQPNPVTTSGSMKQRGKGSLVFVLLLLLILCLAGTSLVGIISYRVFLNSPKLVEGAYIKPGEESFYKFSDDQLSTLTTNGIPDSFTITFYTEEFDPVYRGEVREETWRYFNARKNFHFYNGTLTAETDITDAPPAWLANLYRPDQFSMYASLDSVLATAAIDDYFELPLEDALVKSGKLYYAPGLTFGIVNDRLVYAETVSMAENGAENDQ